MKKNKDDNIHKDEPQPIENIVPLTIIMKQKFQILEVEYSDHGKKTKRRVTSYFHSNFSPISSPVGGSNPARTIITIYLT